MATANDSSREGHSGAGHDGAGHDGPVHKARPTRAARLRRLIVSVLDPRAWLHLLKIVNYYNVTHATPARRLTRGRALNLSPTASLSNPENIVLGERVRIGAHSSLWAGPARGRIVLGDDVVIGPNVMVTAANYRFNDGSPVNEQAMNEADVIVGRDAWIGAGAVLLPGAQIGDGAIIGAGAIIRGKVAPGAIMVGPPAGPIGQRRGWDNATDEPDHDR